MTNNLTQPPLLACYRTRCGKHLYDTDIAHDDDHDHRDEPNTAIAGARHAAPELLAIIHEHRKAIQPDIDAETHRLMYGNPNNTHRSPNTGILQFIPKPTN